MKYKRKAGTVEVFRFGISAEMNAPKWFAKAVQSDVVTINRCIMDGAVHVYGCTIQTKFGKLRVKNGDYIVLEPSGEMIPHKLKDFKKIYEKE